MPAKPFAKPLLQLAVLIGGCVPVLAGLTGVLLGPAMVADAGMITSIPADSHFRYLSGLLLGIGLGFWSTIPHIELRGARFQLLTAIVFIGGLSRFWSLIEVGLPDLPMRFGLVMELIVTPLLAYGQYRLARRAGRRV